MELNILYTTLSIIVGLAVAFITYFVIGWLKEKAKGTNNKLDDIILAAVHKPLVIFIIVTSVYLSVTVYNVFPESLGPFETDRLVNTFFILLFAWVTSSFSYDFIRTYGGIVAERTESDIDDRVVPKLAKTVKYMIWFVALLVIIGMYVADITPILAGAGIAGIAVALAAQDILGNIFGGTVIAMDKPFKIGDRIEYNSLIGDVVQVGLRSTRIRTTDNRIITIPNKKLTESDIINYSLPDPSLKVYIPFSFAYGSDFKKVKKVLLEIAHDSAEKTPWVMSDPEPSVYILEFGDSCVNGKMIVWTNSFHNVWDVKDWINEQIDERFAKEGIEIPYNQVEVRMRDGK
ncbi:MAG TPA: mechanosensitive ion channel [Methanoregula sp.]|nr:mechanosensitive ion channel [Methanoregula sp.]